MSKAVELYPKEISQRDKQLALFNGNHYLFTPYKVKTQTTKVNLPSNTVESYSKNVKPVSQSESKITYGPYANIDPLKEASVKILVIQVGILNPNFAFLGALDNSLWEQQRFLDRDQVGEDDRVVNVGQHCHRGDCGHQVWSFDGLYLFLDPSWTSSFFLHNRHSGAKLRGSFSRYEFQRENSGVSSVKSFKTVLPAAGECLWGLYPIFV